jgi:hypothetical protein
MRKKNKNRLALATICFTVLILLAPNINATTVYKQAGDMTTVANDSGVTATVTAIPYPPPWPPPDKRIYDIEIDNGDDVQISSSAVPCDDSTSGLGSFHEFWLNVTPSNGSRSVQRAYNSWPLDAGDECYNYGIYVTFTNVMENEDFDVTMECRVTSNNSPFDRDWDTGNNTLTTT